jgi:acid phosphatase type 7
MLVVVAALAISAPMPPSPVAAATVATVYLVGAGDIAACDSSGDERTAALLDRIEGTVYTTGDNVYETGTAAEWSNCYAPSWGRHKGRTRPTAGNHEYQSGSAAGYFNYFGGRAGHPGKGWYAYNRGAWRIYALNSNCSHVGGCWVGSPQERWLRADLAANPRECVLAYWHHPRFSSGEHGNSTSVRGLWRTLYAAGADVILNGHDHDYERFALQDWNGQADPQGIRQFVVGTGGRSLDPFVSVKANSQKRSSSAFGVLSMALGDGWYRWRFVPVDAGTFSDSGTTNCH